MLSRQFLAAVGAILLGCPAAGAQTSSTITFSRVATEPGLGLLEFVHAVADFNGDGRDDIIAGGLGAYMHGATPEDRFTKTTLQVFVSEGDGQFRHAPELVEGTIEVRSAVVVAADFNGDTRPDLAVFDGGLGVAGHGVGYGNPPQLFLSSRDAPLRPSDALADAVRREHELRPDPCRTPNTRGPPTFMSRQLRRATSTAMATSTCGSKAPAAPMSRATS